MNYASALDEHAPGRVKPGLEVAPQVQLGVTICGSFRRDREGLRADRDALVLAGCAVLSPRTLDWAEEVDGFVYAAEELGRSPADVERGHLEAMRSSHFLWLHAPDGYVGSSAAMELGYAHALGLPVFAREVPSDVTLAGLVRPAASAAAAVNIVQEYAGDAPSAGIDSLQRYYRRASTARGWDSESPDDCLSLLEGEVDELSEAISQDGLSSSAASLELADVQLYLVHLANIAGIRLSEAVAEKERINTARFGAAVPSR